MAATVKKATAKKATAKKAVPVVTEGEVSMEARLAAMERRLAEAERREAEAERRGYEKGKAAKRAERSEKAARRQTPGLHPVSLRDGDARYNVLARCEYVVPGVGVVEGTAVMIERDGDYLARFGLAPNAVFGIPGVTGVGEEECLAVLSSTLEAAPEMLAYLRETFDAAADSHEYLSPADRKRQDAEAKAKG